MASRFNELKNALSNKLKAVEAQNIVTQDDIASDQLISDFQEMISNRDKAFGAFNDLYKERVNIYDTFISLFYIHFYNNKIQTSSQKVKDAIKILQVIKTDLFVSSVESYMMALPNNAELGNIKSYFISFYDALKELLYPDTVITFNTSNNELTIGSNDPFSEEDLPDQTNIDKFIYIIRYLYETTPSISFLSEYKDFLTGEKEESAYFKIMQDLNTAKGNIENSITSYLLIDAYRQEKDSGYHEEFISEIKELFNALSEELAKLSDFSIEGINFMEQVGQFDTLYARFSELQLAADELIYDGLISLEKIEYFMEDYSPFVRMPLTESKQLSNSISVINSMNFDELENAGFVNPFSGEGSELEKLDFLDWNEKLLETKLINADIFNLILLRIGILLSRELTSNIIGEELISFSFLRLIDKQLVNTSILSTEFNDALVIKTGLLDADIEIVRRYQDDIIAFGFKDVLPELEVLDYMNFDEINDETLEPAFGKDVEVLILEAFLKNKKELDLKINRMIDFLYDGKFTNAKSLYVKIKMHGVMQKFSTYLNGNAGESNIEDETLNNIDRYLELTDISIDETDLENYLSAWTYFYDNDDTSSFVDRVISNETIKNLLK